MNVRPTGLKGNDKLSRIHSLMKKMDTINEEVSNSSIEHVKKAPNGVVYGIIRENHKYFIKTSNKKDLTGLISEDFNYIGGLQNKNLEAHSSYEEALKHLNLKFRDLNESFGIKEGNDLFRSDLITESNEMDDEDVVDEQEYKLKIDSPETTTTNTVSELPSVTPTSDNTEEITADTSAIEPSAEETSTEVDITSDENEGDDVTKQIQKLTGKLGQKIRSLDQPDLELEKYVINSIISALHWNELGDDFKESVISKIENEGQEDGDSTQDDTTTEPSIEGGDETSMETPDSGEEVTVDLPEKTNESVIFSKKQLLENLLKNKKKNPIVEYRNDEDFCEECERVCNGNHTFEEEEMEEHHNLSPTNYGKYDDDEYILHGLDEEFEDEFSDDDYFDKKLHVSPHVLGKNENGHKYYEKNDISDIEDLEEMEFVDFGEDLDGNEISDRLEVMSDPKETPVAPPKTPTKDPVKVPRRQRPFQPAPRPKPNPKGEM